MEINRIGNKNCWIKNGFQHWRFFNRGCFLILGDHLFLNCIFFGGRRRLINNGLLINPDLTLFMSIHFPFIFLSFSSQCAFMSSHLPFICTHVPFILHSCPFISFLKLWKWLYGLARGPSATNGYR